MGLLSRLFGGNKWVLIGTTVADPQTVSPELANKVPLKTLEKMLLGVTTYIWENPDGTEIKKEEFLGTDETPLKQLLSRVDMWQKVDLMMEGKKYAVVRLQDSSVISVVPSEEEQNVSSPIQTTDITKLPVR
jgi:hypothetical protein